MKWPKLVRKAPPSEGKKAAPLVWVIAVGLLLLLSVTVQPENIQQSQGPQPAATLGHSAEGLVSLQRRYPLGDASWKTKLRVQLYAPGEEEPLEISQRSSTDTEGYFYFYVAEAGLYDIGAKSAHSLESRIYSTKIVTGFNQGLLFGTLLEGDADDSNVIDDADHDLLVELFATGDTRADFDQDGLVTILDFSWLYTNYGESGPTTPPTPEERPSDRRFEVSDMPASIALSIPDASVGPGQIFSLPVEVRSSNGALDGIEIHLRFNPRVLQVVDSQGVERDSITPGDALDNVIQNRADNVRGTIDFAAGVSYGEPLYSGDLRLAEIFFKSVVERGWSAVSFSDPLASQTGRALGIESDGAFVYVGEQVYGVNVPLAMRLTVRTGASALPQLAEAPDPPVNQELPVPLVLKYALSGSSADSPRQRIGVCVHGSIEDYDVFQLGRVGWYHNWNFGPRPSRPGGVSYVQLIRVRNDEENPELDFWEPDWATIAATIEQNRGSLWLIGNEPDVYVGGQDNCTPAEYAERYHQCYTFIKARDPLAQISAAGIVQPSELRLKWLDQVLEHYMSAYGEPMPVDVWNIHVQILREVRGEFEWGCQVPPGLPDDLGEDHQVQDNVSLQLFQDKIVQFRTWMRDHGERQKPLIISEYGVLMPSGYGYLGGRDAAAGDQMVSDYMSGTLAYCLEATDPELGYSQDGDHLVQKWAWHSLNHRMADFESSPTYLGFNGSLFHWVREYPGSLTQFGLRFRDELSALE